MRGNNMSGTAWADCSGRFALIGGHVFVEAVFGYHQPEIFEVFAESLFKLRKYDV